MAKHKVQRQTVLNGRFQTILTPELVDKLCETHQARDFRNVTAVRCGVHPKLLSKWLRLGAANDDAGLCTDLFMRMAKIEGDIRAELLAEVADPTASLEQTEFENGKPASKTLTARRTSGIQWLLEKRFHQFRVEHVVTDDERDVTEILQPAPQAMTREMAVALCQQMAAQPGMLPPEIRALFAATDWGSPALKDSNHDQAEAHH